MSTTSNRWQWARPRAVPLVPLLALATAIVYAAGWAIHTAGVPAWLTGTVAAVGAGAVLIAVLARTGPGASAGYTLACGLCAGGWLVYASTTSPGAWFAILALALAATGLGCLYPLLRRHQQQLADQARRRAAEERRKADERKWPDLLERVGFPGIGFRGQSETRFGHTINLILPASGRIRYATLAEAKERIEIAARLRHGAVRIERGRRAHEVLLHVAEQDVLAEPVQLPEDGQPLTVNRPLPVGLHEDGTVCSVTLREVATLIVGLRGSGKSNLINVLIAQLSRCTDTVIFMIDLKGGRTALPWLRPWFGIDARANSGAGGEKITPSPRLPAVLLIVEEVAVLFGMNTGPRSSLEGTTNATLAALGTQITQLGRSEAIDPVLVTQRGTSTMIGSGDLKSQCAVRIGLGVATEADARLVLPDDTHIAADLARLTHPGSGFVQAREGRAMPVKFYRLTHERIAGIAEDAGYLRPSPDPLLAEALGDDYARRWSSARAGHLPVFTPPAAEDPARLPQPASHVPARRSDTDREFAEIVAGLGKGNSSENSKGDRTENSEGNSTGSGNGNGRGAPDAARRRMLDLLDASGVMGATAARLLAMLEVEGIAPARESLESWLAEEASAGRVRRASHGRWKTR